MITCTIQEIQRTKHSNTLIWSLNVKGHPRPNVIQGQGSWGQLKDHIYDLLSVLYVNIGHNMHHSEDTAHYIWFDL